MNRGGVVYVVAKAPLPRRSKTRLCPPLRPEQAARLARAFLIDTLAIVGQAGVEARIVCRDAVERNALRRLIGSRAGVYVQAGTGLGAALESAFGGGLTDGYAAVAVLGADSPTLPPVALEEAFAVLERGSDVALGPTEDGGYYLLAARRLHAPLFRDMPWSTSAVAQITLDRCAAAGLRPHLLPTWYDVDDAASLGRLSVDLLEQPGTVAPATRAELERLGPLNPRSDARHTTLRGVAGCALQMAPLAP